MKLFTKMHYLIHLNLAISLLLGFLVFIGGINYASEYEASVFSSHSRINTALVKRIHVVCRKFD